MKRETRRAAADAHRTVFAPVDTQARVEAVVRRLGDAIHLGLLADGEQLPGESDLAARLGVSTVTVREALRALRQQGLLTTRRGRGGGSFVHLPDGPPETRLHARLAEWSTEELRDLADHWTAVSGAAARLAAQRTEPDDLCQLRRTTDELGGAGSAAVRSRAHGRFHVELAAAAQSARLTREMVAIQREVGAPMCLVLGEELTLKDISDRHRTVISAVQNGADEKARALAEGCVQASTVRLIALRLGVPGTNGGPGTHGGPPPEEH